MHTLSYLISSFFYLFTRLVAKSDAGYNGRIMVYGKREEKKRNEGERNWGRILMFIHYQRREEDIGGFYVLLCVVSSWRPFRWEVFYVILFNLLSGTAVSNNIKEALMAADEIMLDVWAIISNEVGGNLLGRFAQGFQRRWRYGDNILWLRWRLDSRNVWGEDLSERHHWV